MGDVVEEVVQLPGFGEVGFEPLPELLAGNEDGVAVIPLLRGAQTLHLDTDDGKEFLFLHRVKDTARASVRRRLRGMVSR